MIFFENKREIFSIRAKQLHVNYLFGFKNIGNLAILKTFQKNILLKIFNIIFLNNMNF